MNIKQKFFLAFITIASLLTSPHAVAEDTPARNYGRGVFQDIPVLSQGDQVFIDKRKTCTVGYIGQLPRGQDPWFAQSLIKARASLGD